MSEERFDHPWGCACAIDWNLKESVRARMKVAVKRLLRQYGYPPDMEALATELVLEQAKVFTEFEVNVDR